MVQISGYDGEFYSLSSLKSDYRKGLVLGITFCLFAMPMLTSGPAASQQEDSRSSSSNTSAGEHSGKDVPRLDDEVDSRQPPEGMNLVHGFVKDRLLDLSLIHI